MTQMPDTMRARASLGRKGMIKFSIVSMVLVGGSTHAFHGGYDSHVVKQRPVRLSRPLHVMNRPLLRLSDKRRSSIVSHTPRHHTQSHSYQYKAIAFPQNSHLDDGPRWEEILALQSYTAPDHPDISRTDKGILCLALGLLASSLFLLLTLSGPGSWRYFMAGGICAAVSHALPTPIDVVKVGCQFDFPSVGWC